MAASFGVVLAAFGVVGSYDELMGRPKENAWLSTLPASERQHYAARLLGIAAYVGLMAVSVAVPVAVRTGLAHGVASGLQVGGLVAAGVVWTAGLSLAVLWAISLALSPRIARPTLSVARTVLIATLVLGYQWIGAEPEAAAAPWWPAAWLADAMVGRSTLGLALLVGAVGVLVVSFSVVFPRRYFHLLDRIADGTRWAEESGHGQNTLTWPERLAVRGAPATAPPMASRWPPSRETGSCAGACGPRRCSRSASPSSAGWRAASKACSSTAPRTCWRCPRRSCTSRCS